MVYLSEINFTCQLFFYSDTMTYFLFGFCRFIARLEEVLHEWKVVNNKPKPPAVKVSYIVSNYLIRMLSNILWKYECLMVNRTIHFTGKKTVNIWSYCTF